MPEEANSNDGCILSHQRLQVCEVCGGSVVLVLAFLRSQWLMANNVNIHILFKGTHHRNTHVRLSLVYVPKQVSLPSSRHP